MNTCLVSFNAAGTWGHNSTKLLSGLDQTTSSRDTDHKSFIQLTVQCKEETGWSLKGLTPDTDRGP